MSAEHIHKQVRMVFDLNKCIGCQGCTMACKTMWTDRNKGQQYMYWNNVETRPGVGYPRQWEKPGDEGTAGFPDGSSTVRTDNPLPELNPAYGAPWEYNYSAVLATDGKGGSQSLLIPTPPPDGAEAYGPNWDEDVGAREMPNNYYFYLPRMCNHCTKPACVAACPRQSVYKREEDGIVLIDRERCRGYRYCVKGCPYKKAFYNPDLQISEKCIFCFPRISDSKGINGHPFCFSQCTGRVRFAGWFKPGEAPSSTYNQQFNVNRLVYEFGVALRLHPEYGTEPNLFYVPPLSPPTISGGAPEPGTRRIPVDYLAYLFGDTREQSHAERVARIEGIFAKLEAAARGDYPELQEVLVARTEADRLQLDKIVQE